MVPSEQFRPRSAVEVAAGEIALRRQIEQIKKRIPERVVMTNFELLCPFTEAQGRVEVGCDILEDIFDSRTSSLELLIREGRNEFSLALEILEKYGYEKIEMGTEECSGYTFPLYTTIDTSPDGIMALKGLTEALSWFMSPNFSIGTIDRERIATVRRYIPEHFSKQVELEKREWASHESEFDVN